MLQESIPDQLMKNCPEVLSLFQTVCKELQLFRHDRVEDSGRAGNGLAGAGTAEFKFIAGEGNGGGAVPVGSVSGNAGKHIHADPHGLLHLIGVVRLFNDGIHNGLELISQENGKHGGRGFVSAQTVVISGKGNGAAEQLRIFVNALDKGCQEKEELGILAGSLSGGEQIFSAVRGKAPVDMLAGPVDACKVMSLTATTREGLSSRR